MYLKDYFSNIKKEYSKYSFSNIAFDSSKIKKNYIFFAIKGNHFDGHNFIGKAIKNGSKIIVHEKKFTGLKNGILFLYSKNIRKQLAQISFKLNNLIPKNLIAVTGTNGKSSVADFYFQILKLNKKKVASIGTLGVKMNNSFNELSNTTIDPISLSKILTKLKKRKIENVIMEASSHGLEQNRLDGLKFNVGIFTNLSHDHLDYHKSMKRYLKAKLYLFQNLLNKNKYVITDQSNSKYAILKKICKKKSLKLNTFSENDKHSKIKLKSYSYEREKLIIKIKNNNKERKISLNLIGKIQIKNLMMAIIAAEKSNLSFEKIVKCIPKILPINGRLENVGKIKNNSKVVLDYAHTPDALKIALTNLKDQFPNKKISIVFGCGGERDRLKRPIMGRIAAKYCKKIYLTDDNPRNENPNLIRNEIKKGINIKNIYEIKDRKKAIKEAILNLKSSEILLIAGKGHENTQTYKNKVRFFSDKNIIINSINLKNKNLSNDIKLNIIKELSKTKLSFKNLKSNKVVINSKQVKKNDIFFTIKGRKKDAHKYLGEVSKKKALIAIVGKVENNLNYTKQLKVKNTLKFLINSAKSFRESLNSKIIAITGSCGKTSLKDMLGSSLKRYYQTSYSKKSFNNKYGVPLSLLNINQRDKFGVLEVGMDKKGEINFLTDIIKPDVGVITNISYAHIKNFNNISQIASAKGEIINNINPNGYLVLNADDKFFNFHRKLADKKNIKILSFSQKKENTTINIKKITKEKNKYKVTFRIDNKEKFFYIRKNFNSFLYNLLASIAVMHIYIDVFKLSKNLFLDLKTTQGRGDILKLKVNKKKITIIDESYNSNPLSLESALQNFNKLEVNSKKKYLVLGDMLELGKHSKKLHVSMAKTINKILVNKVYVIGKDIKETFKKIHRDKKGSILKNDSQLNDLIKNKLKDGDYLMIKGSNSTGLFNYVSKLKGRVINAL